MGGPRAIKASHPAIMIGRLIDCLTLPDLPEATQRWSPRYVEYTTTKITETKNKPKGNYNLQQIKNIWHAKLDGRHGRVRACVWVFGYFLGMRGGVLGENSFLVPNVLNTAFYRWSYRRQLNCLVGDIKARTDLRRIYGKTHQHAATNVSLGERGGEFSASAAEPKTNIYPHVD